jgi:pimeloyl-ACP methyl ester carboxylesterase
MLEKQLDSPLTTNKDAVLRELADTIFDSDVFDPATRDLEMLDCQYEINKRVWKDFVELRDRNGLRDEFSRIDAPLTVIHGDFDPHPLEGIVPFLRSCSTKVTVQVLEQCGHYPWIEKHAREAFFKLLKRELSAAGGQR